MFGNGPFGLRAWSLADPAHPRQIGELPAAALALPGDDVSKGFREGEHLQSDPVHKLVFVTRDLSARTSRPAVRRSTSSTRATPRTFA
ncbi:MAG TPA: hypothetical protein VJT49_28610 [Amycolatopsis sp.]|uniref:hypothetical protein n=1 Tax=Amycolatopsis sp. TaxID=37632 RepID=UPI002B47CEBC|nr:hypothetical protein [Amycolatopsis sp.]HKS49000.1 hypothetical protein [Amycolatopsis sp.]